MQIELNYPDPVPVKLEPAKTMLLIVDMENEDLHPTGKRYMGETAAQIIPSIAALRRRVRQAGGLVVHTQSVRKPDALEFKLSKTSCAKWKEPGAPNSSTTSSRSRTNRSSSSTRTTAFIELTWNRSWSGCNCALAKATLSSRGLPPAAACNAP